MACTVAMTTSRLISNRWFKRRCEVNTVLYIVCSCVCLCGLCACVCVRARECVCMCACVRVSEVISPRTVSINTVRV